MGLMLLWILALRLMGAGRDQVVALISTSTAQMSWELRAGVNTPVVYSRPMNIDAILDLVHVNLQIIPHFSRDGARQLTVILWMMQL